MTRKTLAVFLTVCASSVFGLSAAAQMTDDAVVNYVKEGMAAGKSQQEMISELARRGVTREQAERLKERFEQEQGQAEAVQTAGVQERTRRSVDAQNEIVAGDMDMVVTEAVDPTDATATEAADVVYGRNIFSTRNLTFAPSENLATPENYTLGPGDEVIIDIWGTNQTTIRQTISPDGFININDIGLVYLSGMTVKEADSYMRRKLNQIYSVDGDDAKSEMKLSLGSIRTIQVNIMGEVVMPGTYYLSSMSNLYHAVYRAGGVNALGSLRDIQLVRDGKKVASVDVYDFLQNGALPADITLQEGDIILVHPYDALVDISGNVKRPMFYELKEGETIGDLISYAGGFTGDAYSSNLRVIRRNGREYQIFTVDQPEYSSFNLMDGDAVSVGAMLDRYENKLEIRGAVYRPGIYQLCDNISTVSQLIAKADGLTGDAFTNRAILHREKEDLTLEVIPLDIKSILDGAAPDVTLQKNDALYIPSIHDLNDIGYITVSGEVARPGDFVFADNTTLEDIIIQAGGLLESASTVKVDVSRRIKDPYSTEPTDTISRIYSFSIKDGFVIDGEQGFVLAPYDQVMVRRSPGYSAQRQVSVSGEVVFAGNYSLTHKNQRISELVADAGGVTDWAYVKGARLVRRINSEERTRMDAVLETMSRGRDSIDVTKLDMGDVYYVGIDLADALANPGSDKDLVLREGDELRIPEYNNTVRVSGNVMYPNTVVYDPDMKVKDFVEMAGGYGFRSKKNRAYVIYMNGTVAKARKSSRGVVQPGCEIVVPEKVRNEGALQNVLSIATTSASLATMIATIGNIIK